MCESVDWGLQAGLGAKSTCHQDWKIEFGPQNPHGRWRELTPSNCPLIYTSHGNGGPTPINKYKEENPQTTRCPYFIRFLTSTSVEMLPKGWGRWEANSMAWVDLGTNPDLPILYGTLWLKCVLILCTHYSWDNCNREQSQIIPELEMCVCFADQS